MAEKDIVIKEKIEHFGVFDFEGLYEYSYGWFKDEKYGIIEEKYKEKVSGNSKDIEIEWKCTKKISDYFKVEIGVEFDIKGLADVEVESNGKKKKMNKGKIGASIKGTLIKDPESKWDSTPFNRFLRDLYNKYIIPARVETMEGRVEDDVQGFKEKIKQYLELTGRR